MNLDELKPRAYAGCRACCLRKAEDELVAFEVVGNIQSVGEEAETKAVDAFALAWAEPVIVQSHVSPWRVFVNAPTKVKWRSLRAHWAKVLVLPDKVPAALHEWMLANKVIYTRLEHDRTKLKKALTSGKYGAVFEYDAAHAVCEFVGDCPEGAKRLVEAVVAAELPEPINQAALLRIRRSFGAQGYANTKTKYAVDGAELAAHLGKRSGPKVAAGIPKSQAVGSFAYIRRACSNKPKSVLWMSVLWAAFLEKKMDQKCAIFLVALLSWMEAHWESTLTESSASSASMADPPGRRLLNTLSLLPTFPTTVKS